MDSTKTIREINEKIRDGNARVVTASEMPHLVDELGVDQAVHDVDVVTTGTFGAMCSSGMWMNFGHSEPPIKMTKVWINDVEAYAGVAAVDAYLGATQTSDSLGISYGGGHVIEDLVRGRPVTVRAQSYGTDCCPRKELTTELTLDELNQARLSNPRNCYERYAVATNSTDKTLYTYMGKLLPNHGNATFSGAGELSPIVNDPSFRAIGIGTRILLGGAPGYVVGSGTQHNPQEGYSTLMIQGDLKRMSSNFLRGATLKNYGCTLFVGVGVPIPILNADLVRSTSVRDEDIKTSVLDYGYQSRSRPELAKVNYADLKSGSIEIDGEEITTSPISSFSVAGKIADLLKNQIKSGSFMLTEAVHLLPDDTVCNVMPQRKSTSQVSLRLPPTLPDGQSVYKDNELCVNCGLCIAYCPSDVFTRDSDWNVSLDPDQCVECGHCKDVCPHCAIAVVGQGGD
ncbi:MAG: homocysteine biosynthesis protein [Candidatus Thorarchaeota archaeon]